MRTKEDTELIVTDFVHNNSPYEYILVTIQNCNFIKSALGEGDEEGKEWKKEKNESWFARTELTLGFYTRLNF